MLDRRHLLNLTESGLRTIQPSEVRLCAVNGEVVTHFLRLAGAYWRHDGDVSRPHAQLTSGRCSDGYVDVPRLLRYSNVCMLLGRELVRMMVSRTRYVGPVGWVVGSDHSAATISFAVAFEMCAKHDFTEKKPVDWNDTTQVWRRFRIGPDEAVLQCEDILTTMGTLRKVRNGIISGNEGPVTFAPVILTPVNRSGLTDFDGSPIISLVDLDIKTWEQGGCPLCAAGSPRVKPKQNWEELVGKA